MDGNQIQDLQNEIAELHDKLDELTDIAVENQRMVKNLYHRARMATVVVFIKWFVIIGLTVGAFYYVQPLINNLVNIYGGITGGTGTDLFNLIKSI
jgi:hypothetical protein